jgi:hypothetical protein
MTHLVPSITTEGCDCCLGSPAISHQCAKVEPAAAADDGSGGSTNDFPPLLSFWKLEKNE